MAAAQDWEEAALVVTSQSEPRPLSEGDESFGYFRRVGARWKGSVGIGQLSGGVERSLSSSAGGAGLREGRRVIGGGGWG